MTKRVAVQTLLWSLEFVIKIIIEHDTITELFKGCFEISISVIVKHVQSIGIIRAFCLPGGQKKLLGCGLLGGISTQADTIKLFTIL